MRLVKILQDWCVGKGTFERLLPYNRPLRQDQLLEKKKSGKLLVYVQCDLKVSEHKGEKLQTPRHFGKKLPCVDKMLHRYWRSMLKRKGYWLNRDEC